MYLHINSIININSLFIWHNLFSNSYLISILQADSLILFSYLIKDLAIKYCTEAPYLFVINLICYDHSWCRAHPPL